MRISHFNSRPHGGRQHRAKKVRTRMNISTHALTEGDTFLVILILHFFHFNSRPHGGRLQERLVLVRQYYFNSRPHGGRPCFFSRIFFEISFQLTPSRRATQDGLVSGYLTGFQLTPSRRATSFLVLFYLLLCISTHALTEGDDVAEMAVTCCDISTHALTEGDRSLLHTNSLECQKKIRRRC